VVHIGVTRAPTKDWTARQLGEVTPFGKGPQALIRDGDTKYGAAFDLVAEGVDIEVLKIAPCALRMNAVCERFRGGVRREWLNHIIVLGEDHLRSVPSVRCSEFQHSAPSSRAPSADAGRETSDHLR
jgi:putative transposase